MNPPPFLPEDIPALMAFAETVVARMKSDMSHGDLFGSVMKAASNPSTRETALKAMGTATLQSLFWFYDEGTPEALAVVQLLKKRLKL